MQEESTAYSQISPTTRSREITADYVRSVLSYDPDTGEFVWRVSRGPTKAGSRAGYSNGQGYVFITVGYGNRATH